MTASAYSGFSPNAARFYRDLEKDNSKAYWEKHRDEFEDEVRAPMEALLASMPSRYASFRAFRPYRDVRFSADKSPYKLQHGATSSTDAGATYYVHIDGEGLLAAAGMYQLQRDQLHRMRRAVAEPLPGEQLVELIAQARDDGLDVDSGMEPPLRTAPRGYPKDHERIELLRWKGCITSARLDADDAARPESREWVLSVFERSQPIVDWLERHVGATTEPVDTDRPGRRRA